jgi:hypothetical protein
MLKSLTKLARNRGYAVRELVGRLQDLRPLSQPLGLEEDEAASLDEIVQQLKRVPELSVLLDSRDSLLEAGRVPRAEADHTLKIPLSDADSQDTEFLCVTRLDKEKWTCYRDRIQGQRP